MGTFVFLLGKKVSFMGTFVISMGKKVSPMGIYPLNGKSEPGFINNNK
jgi:hypothetical protein